MSQHWHRRSRRKCKLRYKHNKGQCICPPPFILWTFPTQKRDAERRKQWIVCFKPNTPPVKPPETFVTANTIVSLIFNIIYTVDHLGLWTQTLEGGLQVVAQVDHLGLWTQTLESGL
ncbi:hypothetical protein Bbelb_283370 [Branchiostoma belcheri]|nr:hypothetical protein Bbelb_283370 [Branchiostoma belcheri]